MELCGTEEEDGSGVDAQKILVSTISSSLVLVFSQTDLLTVMKVNTSHQQVSMLKYSSSEFEH